MRKIASVTLASNTGTFSLDNIPQNGKHLMIVTTTRGSGSLYYNGYYVQPNSTAWGTSRYIYDEQGSMYFGTGNPLGQTMYISTGSSQQSAELQPTGLMVSHTFFIGNYTSTTIAKTMTEEFVVPAQNTTNFRLATGVRTQASNTSAITSIQFYAVLPFVAQSTMSVYILD
jgi:hypothetical protein